MYFLLVQRLSKVHVPWCSFNKMELLRLIPHSDELHHPLPIHGGNFFSILFLENDLVQMFPRLLRSLEVFRGRVSQGARSEAEIDSLQPPLHAVAAWPVQTPARGNLAVANLPPRMASETRVVIPSDGANIIQTAPGLPTVALQASGATPEIQFGVQQLGISTSAPQQVPQKGPLETFLKAEAKVLGAIEILIGLIHIGFGAISLYLVYSGVYFLLSAIGGYPFWGGIFFISSGSLCVAAANCPNRGLVKSSVGMNITSAIMSIIGIILYISELIIYNHYSRYIRQNTYHNLFDTPWMLQNVCPGLSSVLLLFSVLEFCIAVSLAHFGCQATCCSDDQSTVLFVPYQVIRGEEVTVEPNPPPPTYNNVVTKTQ